MFPLEHCSRKLISRAEPTSGLQLTAGLKGKRKPGEGNGDQWKGKKHHYFPVQIPKEQNGHLELNGWLLKL